MLNLDHQGHSDLLLNSPTSACNLHKEREITLTLRHNVALCRGHGCSQGHWTGFMGELSHASEMAGRCPNFQWGILSNFQLLKHSCSSINTVDFFVLG